MENKLSSFVENLTILQTYKHQIENRQLCRSFIIRAIKSRYPNTGQVSTHQFKSMKRLFLTLLLALLTDMAFAQLTVMMSGGFTNPYKMLLPEFERSTGIAVTTLSGASQGSGPKTIKAQLEKGARVDVVILSREGLQELIDSGRIAKGTDKDLGIAPLAGAVQAGASKPDISTVEKLKATLLNTQLISVPGSTSGIFLINEVFPKMGIAQKISVVKSERGSEAVDMLASKKADFAILPTSELMFAPGIEMIGRLPAEVQLLQVFAVAAVKDTDQMANAMKLISFLSSKDASPAIQKGGMDLIPGR